MAEFLLLCPCGTTRMYQKYVKGVPNVKHWVIDCKCGKRVECKKKEKAIEMYNLWEAFHGGVG